MANQGVNLVKYVKLVITAAWCILILSVGSAQTSITAEGIRAYKIDSTAQFTAGQLADAYFGDLVLENDRLRAIIARPGKPQMGEVRGGSLIDVVSHHHPVDYIAALNSTADPATTGALVIYESADFESKQENDKPAASVVLRGYVGTLEGPRTDQHVKVETRYTLAADTDQIRIDTQFDNNTTSPAWLQPADFIDWGEANLFVEGAGYGSTTEPVHFVIAHKDSFSLGYYTSGTAPMKGHHSGRNSIVLGTGEVRDLANHLAARKLIAENDDTRVPSQFTGMAASVRPGPGLVVLPGTETRYGIEGGVPVPQPIYVPRQLIKEIDGQTTLSLPRNGSGNVFSQPASDLAADKVRLQPGESFTFTRYLVTGTDNWAPIAEKVYTEKKITLHQKLGVVLEAGTDNPVAGAIVQFNAIDPITDQAITGPLLQTETGADGTFTASLPEGKYTARAVALGRAIASPPPIVTADAASVNAIAALKLSPVSTLRFALSEAETATSSPLPSKLTIVSKPPFGTVDYGFSPDVREGVRNTVYMHEGFAVVPLTPGRYRLVASRGIEYDLFEKDITINPGQQLTLSASLPHLMKDRLQGLVSMDAGVMTTASASGYTTPESRVIQAACEGVSVLISGDYSTATDLQSAIDRLGLQRWVKAFAGRRELLHKDGLSADIFVYPLTPELNARFDAEMEKVKDLPPDIALADLRSAFPDLIIEISRPIHPEAGYLNSFPFNDQTRRFVDDIMPPPDFNAIQLVEGAKIGNEPPAYYRYMALQLARMAPDSLNRGAPISATASSRAQLPHGHVVGSPRTYLYLHQLKDLKDVTADDIATAVRGQHFLVTNGPVLLFDGLDREDRAFTVSPGQILDSRTTDIVRIRAQVLAAPWVSLQGINTRENGRRGITVFGIQPKDDVLRYPTHDSGSHIYTRYLRKDTVLDAYAYSTMFSLAPAVPDTLPDYGGPVFPFAWSGPIFVDRDGDGKIEPDQETIKLLPGAPQQ